MIALIAGTGCLPAHACRSLLATKQDFFIISLFPEDNFSELQNIAPNIKIIVKPFYKTKIILEELKKEKTNKVLFIGKVDKRVLLKKFKLDWYAIKMLASLTTKSDFSIMNKIGDILEEHGMSVISQETILKNLFIPPGIVIGKITPEIEANIQMGIETAKQMSLFDIGQTVVVKDKMILAIEAIEGTNSCIRRGISLGKKNIVVCKAAQPQHNKKFDIPTIGSHTIRDIKHGEIAAIAWLSDKTFIADKEKFIQLAQDLGITLLSL
jgi:DUF1009 family protein